MPLQATSGAASYDAFGGGVPPIPNYIEEVFSAFAYPGSDSPQTLTDGIDRTLGALDWFKVRTVAGENHTLWDTARSGALETNTTASESAVGRPKSSYLTQNDGSVELLVAPNTVYNRAGRNYVKWTFRKQPKFFDIVTYTGDGEGFRSIPHNLGSVPGCFFIKSVTGAESWLVYHRSAGTNGPYQKGLVLNTTAAATNLNAIADISQQTSTHFVLGDSNLNSVNGLGQTYVAYLFAHNAGGFGLSGTENVITCESYTGNGSVTTIDLGYEPQWLLIKRISSTAGWQIYDVSRGMPVPAASTSATQALRANDTTAEASFDPVACFPTATGFTLNTGSNDNNGSGSNYVYIAIRRGPMAVPTTGTSVYNADFYNGPNSPPSWNSGFVTDLGIYKDRTGGASNTYDRLRGPQQLQMNSTGAQSADPSTGNFAFMNGYGNSSGAINTTLPSWMFRRAPSYMDVLCYTATGFDTALQHNLAAVPQLAIIKRRNGAAGWVVGSPLLSNTAYAFLNDTFAFTTSGGNPNFQNRAWSNQFLYIGTDNDVNSDGLTYVAYLFASAPGVSKVGTYVGNGGTQTIDCGFTGGARFILTKAATATGSWWVWDTLRGINPGDDPRLALNNVDPEVTNTDSVDTTSSGFSVTNDGNFTNVSGVTYLFLAIA